MLGACLGLASLVCPLGRTTALSHGGSSAPLCINVFAPDGIILFSYEFPHAVSDCNCPVCDSVFTKSCEVTSLTGIGSEQWAGYYFIRLVVACGQKQLSSSPVSLPLSLLLLSARGFCSEVPRFPSAKLSLGYPPFFTLVIPPAGSVKTWARWPLE